MTLGEKIYRLRTEQGMSQENFGDMLGVSRQSVSKWETDQSVPELDKVVAISEMLGVSTDYLLGTESGYLGNTNLRSKYFGDVTMHDVVYDLQKFSARERRDLLKYIKFLKNPD